MRGKYHQKNTFLKACIDFLCYSLPHRTTILMTLLHSVKFLTIGAVSLIVLFLILGASPFRSLPETMITGVFGSLLLGIPFCLKNLHTNSDIQRIVINGEYLSSDERALMIYTRTVILIGWLSSAIIPLDWDVWYQQWPIPLFLSIVISVPLSVLMILSPFASLKNNTFENC